MADCHAVSKKYTSNAYKSDNLKFLCPREGHFNDGHKVVCKNVVLEAVHQPLHNYKYCEVLQPSPFHNLPKPGGVLKFLLWYQ